MGRVFASPITAVVVSVACASVANGSTAHGLTAPGRAAPALANESSLTRLIRAQANGQAELPPGDKEDPLELPTWFRVLLRRSLPGLPKSGQSQYPREALGVLHWLEANPDAAEAEQVRKVKELERYVPGIVAENERRSRYPKEWDRPVPPGSRLDALRRQLEARVDLLPERDLEDQSPLPVWFRVYLRQQFPDLARSGPYQYPRTANRILQRLLDNPDSVELPQ
jgi:hypothetical protein